MLTKQSQLKSRPKRRLRTQSSMRPRSICPAPLNHLMRYPANSHQLEFCRRIQKLGDVQKLRSIRQNAGISSQCTLDFFVAFAKLTHDIDIWPFPPKTILELFISFPSLRKTTSSGQVNEGKVPYGDGLRKVNLRRLWLDIVLHIFRLNMSNAMHLMTQQEHIKILETNI